MAGEKTVLVVGGGISGITAAVEAAEVGCKVILVERLPYLGGRVARMNKYFPKLCPPTCGLEINFKRIRGRSQGRFGLGRLCRPPRPASQSKLQAAP